MKATCELSQGGCGRKFSLVRPFQKACSRECGRRMVDGLFQPAQAADQMKAHFKRLQAMGIEKKKARKKARLAAFSVPRPREARSRSAR